jgi:hypothetical protein
LSSAFPLADLRNTAIVRRISGKEKAKESLSQSQDPQSVYEQIQDYQEKVHAQNA